MGESKVPSRRVDLRLVPAALTSWLVALAGSSVDAQGSWVLTGGLALAGAAALLVGIRRHPSFRRSIRDTMALAFFVGAMVATHCAVSAAARQDGPVASAAGHSVAVTVTVTGSPELSPLPGNSGSSRWMVPVFLREIIAAGTVSPGPADLLVTGGDEWAQVRPGQQLRTTGTLKEAQPGQPGTAILSAASGPLIHDDSFDIRSAAGDWRRAFVTAAKWLPGDAAGLLPGMVTGDISGLPEDLNQAMKVTGMTHLTAVSGANCSLVLGGFLVLARRMRLPRPIAGATALAGLGAFVVLVGSEPSVLRAAVMGCIGVIALAGGSRGRALSFLCCATIALLLFEPTLGSSVGFLLSVLATLGIVLLAGRMAGWAPPGMPGWLAAGVSVPLSAQLLCGPVIAVLQPQVATYALVSNVVAGPLVAPVTICGTVAVPLAAVVPALAVAPVAAAGTCAGAIASMARFFASAPGAALPWAEGPTGAAAMAALSAFTFVGLWMGLHPAEVCRRVRILHAQLTVLLEMLARRLERLCRGPEECQGMADFKVNPNSRKDTISGCCPEHQGQGSRRQRRWLARCPARFRRPHRGSGRIPGNPCPGPDPGQCQGGDSGC